VGVFDPRVEKLMHIRRGHHPDNPFPLHLVWILHQIRPGRKPGAVSYKRKRPSLSISLSTGSFLSLKPLKLPFSRIRGKVLELR
jgi:hypothetical protein